MKAINVGRYKNGDSKQIWRRASRCINQTTENKLKLGDYYRCYVSIFRLMEVSYERSKI